MNCSANREQKNLLLCRGAAYSLLDEVKRNTMNKLTSFLIDEQQAHRKGGLYHKTQVQLAYNSNRIEGSKLTEEQTRYIFETRTIGFKDQEAVPVDDII